MLNLVEWILSLQKNSVRIKFPPFCLKNSFSRNFRKQFPLSPNEHVHFDRLDFEFHHFMVINSFDNFYLKSWNLQSERRTRATTRTTNYYGVRFFTNYTVYRNNYVPRTPPWDNDVANTRSDNLVNHEWNSCKHI